MKSMLILASGVLAILSTAMASPTVTNVAIHTSADGSVQVDYDLSEDAIVTVSFACDGEAIPVSESTLLAGDVNRLVSSGRKSLVWRTDRDIHVFDGPVEAGRLTATVTAWPKSNPPDYLVCDLLCKKSRLYYASADALPFGGVTNRIYKGTLLAMRRIPAAGVEWRMGLYADWQYSITHYVKLTADYYMSVYPLTRLQYFTVSQAQKGSGDWYGEAVDSSGYAPLNGVSWLTFRGGSLWPDNDHEISSETCPLYYLRRQTGLKLDLPTDAQWEFAARVGGTGDGMKYANAKGTVRGYENYGWCNHWGGGALAHPIEVGLYPPSAYGLYDLHGNVSQYCLDYLSTQQKYANHFEGIEPVVDPKGAVRGDAIYYENKPCRSLRGGPWSDGSVSQIHARIGTNQHEEYAGPYNGFRLVCPLPEGE